MAVLESGVLNGKNFLRLDVTDGFILTAYKDNVGIPTVGCGHRIIDADKINVGETISLERARAFFQNDLALMEKRLNRDVRVPLFQFEYDAMVSIIFNCGPYTGADTLIEKINTGHYEKMFDFILPYRIGHNVKLKRRRFQEARLFASGVYDATH
jgi:lysozyme